MTKLSEKVEKAIREAQEAFYEARHALCGCYHPCQCEERDVLAALRTLAETVAREALEDRDRAESNEELLANHLIRFEDACHALLRDPHGCVFCDSGKQRNPDKPHAPECGFAQIRALLPSEEE